MNVLRLDGVRKTYQNHVAVDGVSFAIPEGCIFGLLGPNGAGKTSIIRIITTITAADQGQVFFAEEPLNNYHPEQIGYLPEERGLYKKMKVGEHLLYLARLKGLSKEQAKAELDSWLKRFEIEDWWDKKVEELSKGMQQKIQFISTVIHKPKLLILDEPFSGLDPINTNLIKSEISRLRDEGTSIIFSTHRMEQVEEICEKIVLISNGKKVLDGDVNEIKQGFKENHFEIELSDVSQINLKDYFEVLSVKGNKVVFHLPEGQSSEQIISRLFQAGQRMISFREILPSLNEIFIKQVEEESNHKSN